MVEVKKSLIFLLIVGFKMFQRAPWDIKPILSQGNALIDLTLFLRYIFPLTALLPVAFWLVGKVAHVFSKERH